MGVKCLGLLNNQMHLTVVSAKNDYSRGGGLYSWSFKKKHERIFVKKTGISNWKFCVFYFTDSGNVDVLLP